MDVTQLLRRLIIDSKPVKSDQTWPLTTQNLQSDSVKLPELLLDFLSHQISLKRTKTGFRSEKTARLVKSFAQDMCYAVTNGTWQLSKYLLLGMTIRHLTGSAELISLLNRFGHCQPYTKVLELKTAMCDNVTDREGLLPVTTTSTDNIVTHLLCDNFNLNEETPSFSETTHTAHGTIIQEKSDSSSVIENGQTREKTKRRSVNYQPQELEPCYIKQCEPNMETVVTKANLQPLNVAAELDFCWLLCRKDASDMQYLMPSWAGLLFFVGYKADECQRTVEYMPPILSPITDNSTVQELLKTSQKVIREVGQSHAILTFDLAVVAKEVNRHLQLLMLKN